jgi:FtsZ-interacting cell division protein ZipA
MDDINWWVWLIIAVAVIALIAIAYALRKRATARAVERDRHRAGELREEAQVTGVEASHREADAAATRAKAEEARVAAEQLERRAQGHEQDAGQVRADASERLAEAERIDPDVDDDGVNRRTTLDDERPGPRTTDERMVNPDRTTGEHPRDTRRDIP